MEFITNYNWTITIGLILFVILIIIGGALFYAWSMKRHERLSDEWMNEWMKLYTKIQKTLTFDVSDHNYNWLCRLFYKLDSCRYKNPEMREVLLNEFRDKYSEIIKRKNEVI